MGSPIYLSEGESKVKTVEQEQEDDISINAAQLASFIVVLSGLAIVCISAYKTNAGLTIAIKNIFPSNTYSFVLILVVGIVFCTLPLIRNKSVQRVTFKNEFLKHFWNSMWSRNYIVWLAFKSFVDI